MKNANSVVHFEMPFQDSKRMSTFYSKVFAWKTKELVQDSKRMSTFYSKVFAWKTKELGPEMGDYVLATTTPADKNGHPKNTGAINGGFFSIKSDMPAQYPSIVIAVEDIKDSIKKIETAGGKVLGEPIEIPSVGQYVSFFDTEGNRVSIIEPTNEMKNQA